MYLPKSQYIADKLSEFKDRITEELSTFPVPKGDPRKYSNYLKVLQNLNSGNPDVIITSAGEIFSRIGVDLDKGDFSNAVKLYPINPKDDKDEGEDLNSRQLSSEEVITSIKLPPSSKEIKAGVMKRCFYRNTSTGSVKEILIPQAVRLNNNRERFEQVICIDWNIKGPAKDQLVNGYFLEGIETKNQKTLDQLKDLMPGVEVLINGPSEYVKDTLIPNSDTIKPQNKDLVIPSPGKRL